MRWHIELLNQMTLHIEGVRNHIVKKETAKALEEYLRFRHLFRKRYGFQLEWTNIRHLLSKMPSVLESLESDIKEAFSEKVD